MENTSDPPAELPDEIEEPDQAHGSSAGLSAQPQSALSRLASLDALRGFDMFWIIGGGGGASLVSDLAVYTNWGFLKYLSQVQLGHASWAGFRFFDLIFPLFLFISGVTMPLSLTRRLERGESKRALYWRVSRRAVLLVILGMVYNGLLNFQWDGEFFNWHSFRMASVLGLIGISYFLAAVIVLNTKVRGQIILAAGFLLGYWAATMWIPIPGAGPDGVAQAGSVTQEWHISSYIHRYLLPGKLYEGISDPEGFFFAVPASALALIGAIIGCLLLAKGLSVRRKISALLLAGLGLIGLGLIVQAMGFPIIKKCWSSSFILFAAGWSILLLVLFYVIVDVWGFRKWAFPFILIGMNPIAIYVGRQIISFGGITRYLTGGMTAYLNSLEVLQYNGHGVGDMLYHLSELLVKLLFLYFLYRKKIFLRA